MVRRGGTDWCPLLFFGAQMTKKTYVYVDGFNFYYGIFHKNPKAQYLKWLDFFRLSELLLKDYDIIKIKYFTALVDSHRDETKSTRQQCYWKAMEVFHGDKFQIIEGNFRTDPRIRPIARFQFKKERNNPTTNMIWVINKEEKGSDVNLATHLIYDGCMNLYDVAFVMTNDSDLTEALRIVKNKLKKEVILLNPHDFRGKKTSRPLALLGLKMRKIRMGVIKESQLPDIIPGTNIHRPDEWNEDKVGL